MNDQSYIDFLQWCLPQLNYKWEGFRKVRKQVFKRLSRRVSELNLLTLVEYKNYLINNGSEWKVIDTLCHITISRFYRDKKVFDTIKSVILPMLAKASIKRKEKELRFWSAGACSGEEPYTLNIIWKLSFLPCLDEKLHTHILATERHSYLLDRAKLAVYRASSLKDLPQDFVLKAFNKVNNEFKLKDIFKENVEFVEQNILNEMPDFEFDLILCRNLVFTYYKVDIQINILNKLTNKLKPGGFLIIGSHETLPDINHDLIKYASNNCIYQKKIK